MGKILTYFDLKDVITLENHEPLVDVREVCPDILCVPINQDMHGICGDRMLVRKTVALRLRDAASSLSKVEKQSKIKLVYGYRHPDIQRRYFGEILQNLRSKFPELSEEDLNERSHRVVAVPEVAGHPTGGAVDVTIASSDGDWDMGTPIWDLEALDLIPTFSTLVSEQARGNRMILRNIMLDQGFAPFDGEWWHFSMGDKEWAAYYKKPCACYSEIRL